MSQEFLNTNELKMEIKHGIQGKGYWALAFNKVKEKGMEFKNYEYLTLLVGQLIFQAILSNTKVCYVQTGMMRDNRLNL